MNEELPIIHDREENVFEIIIDSEIASLKYRHPDAAHLEIYSTYVPESMKGKGIASLLTFAAFEFAAEHRLKVIPTCSYTQLWVERNPQSKEFVEA